MSKSMKILIALDGSDCVKEVRQSLSSAGLPTAAEALVFFAVDTFLPPPASYAESGETFPLYSMAGIRRAHARAERAVAQARGEAVKAGETIHAVFPDWVVRAEACADAPVWGVVNKICGWSADLLVVGSRHLHARWRFASSVMQRTIHEAPCSVHVAREPRRAEGGPLQIVVGLDSSHHPDPVVDAVAARSWPPGSSLRLVTPLASKGKRTLKLDAGHVRDAQRAAEEKLRQRGLHVSSAILAGDLKSVLVGEAEAVGADYIFVGDRRHKFFELVYADTALAVATHAHCSVEIVRAAGTARPPSG